MTSKISDTGLQPSITVSLQRCGRLTIDAIRSAKGHLNYYLRCARDLDVFCPVTLKCKRRMLGVGDGQWCIAENLLPPMPITLSFGVGRDISFDSEMAGRYQAKYICLTQRQFLEVGSKDRHYRREFHFILGA